jgi:hypothetical protein
MGMAWQMYWHDREEVAVQGKIQCLRNGNVRANENTSVQLIQMSKASEIGVNEEPLACN